VNKDFIVSFHKVLFWTACSPCIAHIYLRTKFGAHRSRIGGDTPFYVFFKMAAAAAILELLFSHFGPPAMSPLLGSLPMA